MFTRVLIRGVAGLASASSRQFERGSKSGAFVGMFFGAGAGVGVALLLYEQNPNVKLLSCSILFAVLLGFIGALVGSRLGRRPTFADGELDAEFAGDRAVRITRLNSGLVPSAVFLLLLGVFITVLDLGLQHDGDHSNLWVALLLLGIAVAVAFLAAGFSILWFDVGPNGLTIWRPLRRTTYSHREIAACGFEVAGKVTLTPKIFTNVFRVCFHDGRELVLNVPSNRAVPLAKIFLKAAEPLQAANK